MWVRLATNALTNLLGTVVSLGIGFLMMPFVLSHLGASSFGIWAVVNSIVGYAGLFDVGLSPTLVKKTAEHLAAPSDSARVSLNRTVSTIFTLYLAFGALVCLTVVALVFFAASWFKVPPHQVPTFNTVLLIVGIQAAVNFPMSVWNGLLSGLQEFHLINGLGITINLLRCFFTVLLLQLGYGLTSLVVLGGALAAAGWLFSWRLVRHRIPHLRLSLELFDRACIPRLAEFSGTMVIWSVAGYAVHQADRLLVATFLPLASVAVYEVGARITTYSRNVLHSWLSVFMPAASALSARGEAGQLRTLYLRGTKYLLLSYAGVAVPLLAFGDYFFSLWVGERFQQSYAVMALLLLGSCFQSQNVVAHVLLVGAGRLRVFRYVMASYPVLLGLLSWMFIPRWHLVGAAGAVALTMLVLETCFLWSIVKSFGVDIGEVLRSCQWPTIMSAIPALAWAAVARVAVPPLSWFSLCFDVAVTLAIYAAAAWLWGAGTDERAAIRGKVSGMFVRRGKAVAAVGDYR